MSKSLSIGELARATGMSAATLRIWEDRYGFPRPLRRESGHRRYSAHDVETVLDVQRRRHSGVRLEVAVQHAVGATSVPFRPALFAGVGEAHPELPRQRLHKSTLLGISHAMEDEVVATAQHAHMFASFQTTAHYQAARGRWEEIARVAASAHAFADFTEHDDRIRDDGPGPVRVRIPGDAPMLREWAVVCDAPELAVALLAWEPPGQSGVPDSARVFEVMWSVDPAVVRDAARRCAETAAATGSVLATGLLAGPLAGNPRPGGAAPLTVGRLVMRILGQLEREPRG